MSLKLSTTRRIVIYLTTLMALALVFVPSALAVDPPAISVNPVWRPATQLSSVDGGTPGVTDAPGDDLRYVDAEIYITSSVQFWASDITCTVDKTVLETYTPNSDTGGGPNGNGISSPDDVSIVTYSSSFNTNGNSFLNQEVNTINTDGKINFAMSVTGPSAPIGGNGIKSTFLFATIRYRTKVLTANKTAALTCAASFLDRDGKVVLVPTIVAPAPLSLITGYSIKGKVRYQDQPVQTGIVVECYDSANVLHSPIAPVTAAGDFIINTRNLGTHTCYFYGSKILSDTFNDDAHLTAVESFKLNAAVYNLLPITLRSGNVNRSNINPNVITMSDFSVITANWHIPAATAFATGDANGDKLVDKADLALVVGNYYPNNTSVYVNPSHMIYDLPRDNEKFMNSHIWIGGYETGQSVSQFALGTERNYWATLSPDGSKLAFTRNIGVGNADKFALFVAPITGGVVGAAVNITPGAAFDAFAPSWSPDGVTLAFACAYSRADWTNGGGRANLCLIEATGKNLRQKIALPASREMIKIHPVAWFNNTSMMYGGPDWTGNLPNNVNPPLCNNSICILGLRTNTNTLEPYITPGSDMPTIRSGIMGSVVFYRQKLITGSSSIEFAELYDDMTFPSVVAAYSVTCGNFVGSMHCSVNNSYTSDVGYFNVYTGNNDAGTNQYGIVLYTQDYVSHLGGGTSFRTLTWTGIPSWPSWSFTNSAYSVANAVNNPDITSPNTFTGPNVEGYLALRNTVEWTP